jgi:hypothetical protein
MSQELEWMQPLPLCKTSFGHHDAWPFHGAKNSETNQAWSSFALPQTPVMVD